MPHEEHPAPKRRTRRTKFSISSLLTAQNVTPLVLGVLIVISVFQAVSLVNLKNAVAADSSASAPKVQSVTAPAAAQKGGLEGLKTQVGGC